MVKRAHLLPFLSNRYLTSVTMPPSLILGLSLEKNESSFKSDSNASSGLSVK